MPPGERTVAEAAPPAPADAAPERALPPSPARDLRPRDIRRLVADVGDRVEALAAEGGGTLTAAFLAADSLERAAVAPRQPCGPRPRLRPPASLRVSDADPARRQSRAPTLFGAI